MKYIDFVIPNSQSIADLLNQHSDYELAGLVNLPGYIRVIMVKSAQRKNKPKE